MSQFLEALPRFEGLETLKSKPSSLWQKAIENFEKFKKEKRWETCRGIGDDARKSIFTIFMDQFCEDLEEKIETIEKKMK